MKPIVEFVLQNANEKKPCMTISRLITIITLNFVIILCIGDILNQIFMLKRMIITNFCLYNTKYILYQNQCVWYGVPNAYF